MQRCQSPHNVSTWLAAIVLRGGILLGSTPWSPCEYRCPKSWCATHALSICMEAAMQPCAGPGHCCVLEWDDQQPASMTQFLQYVQLHHTKWCEGPWQEVSQSGVRILVMSLTTCQGSTVKTPHANVAMRVRGRSNLRRNSKDEQCKCTHREKPCQRRRQELQHAMYGTPGQHARYKLLPATPPNARDVRKPVHNCQVGPL